MDNFLSPTETSISVNSHVEHDHIGHHQRFITKYIFSQDHKMIAKQFMVTGIIWAIIGSLYSVLFRLQLGYPDSNFSHS